jgi:aminoglycoside/choline kinase family phosphotransferase
MSLPDRRFVLLLEDLVDHTLVDQIDGMSAEQAEVSLRSIARLHARWWQTSELGELVWLVDGSTRAQVETSQPTVPEMWPGFLDRWGDRLSADAVRLGAAVMEKYPVLQFSMAFNPMTLIHADFRLDNLFFSADGRDVVVIDWQLLSRGPAVYDVAYLLTQSMSSEIRREHETELLRAWHDEVIRCGVATYPFDQFVRDYDVAVLVALAAPLGTTAIDLGNERGERLAFTMAHRAFGAALDRDWQDVLDRF